MSSSLAETVVLRYPEVGEILRVTDRGFGFVSTPKGEEFIHLRDHSGRRLETMEGLQGKLCAYAIGGHPFRYSDKRQGWDRTVVEWRLLDELESLPTAEDYRQKRSEGLAALDKERLSAVLTAEWYIERWRKKTGLEPQAILQADGLLDGILSQRLSDAADAQELVELLASILESPWYAVRDEDRAAVCERFFQPSEWPWSVFVARAPLESYRGYAIVGPLCGQAIESYVRGIQVIAIDVESDGEAIFEFGWRNACGTGVRRSRIGLRQDELNEAVDECLLGLTEPYLVGHNLLDWDWPVLQKHAAPFPESSSLWDTLLASWILEPWLDSHALVVGEGAHTADADAAACYGLFFRQVNRLGSCLAGHSYDTKALVDRLFENPQMLSDIGDRDYPSDLAGTLSGPTIFPSYRASDFAWQRGCRVHLLAQENRLADPVLAVESCRAVAENEQSVVAKAIAAVVADARSNNVHVRLSDLPFWLADDRLRALLREVHVGDEKCEADDAIVIYLAEDLFKLSEDEIDSRSADGALAVAYQGDVAAVWQETRCQKLTEKDVRDRFPAAVEGRRGRALLPVQGAGGNAEWLLHVPPSSKTGSPSWFLLPAMPSWLEVEPAASQAEATPLAWVPRWRDGDASRLDIDRIFVSPDTANRPLYLAELTHCLLNLLKSHPEDEVLVLGVRWSEEAAQLQQNLVQVGVSAKHPGTPLRQLERACKKGLRVLVCPRDEIPKFIQAAVRLGTKIQVVLDEVPLHEWYAVVNAPASPERAGKNYDTLDPAFEGDENEEPSDNDSQDHTATQVLLRGSDIRSLMDVFLHGWLAGMGISTPEAPTCLLLDTRIASGRAAKAVQLTQRDVPFYSVEELLDTNAVQVFYSVCYPKYEERAIPNDYESYRAFLEEHWRYPDFRPNTQKPAIEKLIESDRDMLLRLPTGAGKSIVFHLPALFRSSYSERLTVVITPLRALMRDQVQGLWEKKFTESVDFLSGGRDPWVNHEVYQGILDGRIRLVFVAPERFRVPRFIEALERRRRMDDGLEFVVFDETHCVSEWGFEFRPDYLHAAQYVAEWFKKKDLPGNPHRLLLTSATVTERNRLDLERELSLGKAGDYEDLPEDMPHPIQAYIALESFVRDEDDEAPSDAKFEKMCDVLSELDLDQSAALVFVSRRKDCHRISEALNARAATPGSGLAAVHALPFHAGLAEATKTEACALLKDRKANVLVCTKAFGMGMDIKHVHACIHYRPPTFIEDYLQEVGRIGRSEEERARAGHDRVTATLLYNQADIERNLTRLHENAVSPPDLQDFFGYCVESSVRLEGVGRSLCLVPATVSISETKQFDENQVSSCLFWLERMDVLRIEGRQPPFLNLSLDLPQLRNHAEGSSLDSRIAALLLKVVGESQDAVQELAHAPLQAVPEPQAETVFSRLVRGLLSGVLALVSASEEAEPQPDALTTPVTYKPAPVPKRLNVGVSMSELMSRGGDIGMDDLFSGLYELSTAGVLSIHKSFAVRPNGSQSGDEFFELLEFAVERLLQPTDGRVEFLERKQFELELRAQYQQMLSPESQEGEAAEGAEEISRSLARRIQREVYRAISTSLRILRYSGFELREGLSESGVAHYARALPESLRYSAASVAGEKIRAMRDFVDFVSTAEDVSDPAEGVAVKIPLTQIISALGGDVRVGTIKELMKLAETAGFYEFEGDFGGWVSLVTINTHEPLPPHAPGSDEDSVVQQVYAEMLEKHELQVLRAQAMVLLAAMPAENRKEYIDSYFECMKAEDLTQLLEDTVGDVDDEVLANDPTLQGLLSQVRRERFSEEMGRLNVSQKAVCTAPFNRTLLVNAGPGSGKTHVLMMRCAHLIHLQRIAPAEILVLAFNRAVVYEIRDRVRKLFRELGYGSYANRLAVTTFHSFALRHLQGTELYEEDAIGQAVHTFAQRMKSDPEFARSVGGGYKAILVDEFQDMNEDFYSVVRVLLSNCRGGGMVIGDDDQDILTWNRRDWKRKHGQECPLDAAHYFSEFRESLHPEEHTLTLNYRSVPEIVERSSVMIENAAAQVGFPRMKAATVLEAHRTGDGEVEMPFDPGEYPALVTRALDDGNSVAVLCRSNRECRQIYETLATVGGVPTERIELLGSEDFPLYQLRHSGALLDICHERKDYDFVEPYIWEEFIGEFSERGLADHQEGQDYLELIYELVKAEVGRPRVRDLQTFVEEMRGSDVERLKPKVGLGDKQSRLTIATVHKVKGLEYDTVVIMPSAESFPFGGGDERRRTPTDVDAAEEARLYYVAMTRAREKVYGGWGQREAAWWRCRQQGGEGAARFCLKGSPKECFVSWPGQENQVRSGLQDYIERHVCLGDPLELRGLSLRHEDNTVGLLSKNAAASLRGANANPQLRVSNVIRYTCGNYFREKNADFWVQLDESVKHQGWFYLVLPEEA